MRGHVKKKESESYCGYMTAEDFEEYEKYEEDKLSRVGLMDQTYDAILDHRIAERELQKIRRADELKRVAEEKQQAILRLQKLLKHGSVIYTSGRGPTVRRNGFQFLFHIPVKEVTKENGETKEILEILNITKDIAAATDHMLNHSNFLIVRGNGIDHAAHVLERLSWVIRPKGSINQKFKLIHRAL